jgi:tRNA modification GTPase
VQGALSREFSQLEDGVVWLLAHLEASIDFSAEGIEVVPSRDLLARADELELRCGTLLASYDQGRLLNDGLLAAFLGAPNVGKSSLLNALLNEDRAIVTAEPGTTRDLVEGRLLLGGTVVRLVDTAGLRETLSEPERLGIARSLSVAAEADVVMVVLDASLGLAADGGTGSGAADGGASDLSDGNGAEELADGWDKALDQADPNRLAAAVLINKMDLPATGARRDWFDATATTWQRARPGLRVFFVSAVSGLGLSEVKGFLQDRAVRQPLGSGAVVIQARHFAVLKRIKLSLNAARRLIQEDASPEFIAFELQEAVRGVHELLGKRFDEQVIDRIFKEFCLGK